MGTKSLLRELKKNKIRVTTDCMDEDIACVLVSYDNQLTYEKIQDTCQILSTRKVDYLATNLDYVCPIEFGYVPDCGAICEMLEHAVKRKPKYLGKPGTVGHGGLRPEAESFLQGRNFSSGRPALYRYPLRP